MRKRHQPGDETREMEKLRARLREAEETLSAIRDGRVDAMAVQGGQGRKTLVLDGAEKPYRILTDSMIEGAASLSLDGIILFCNGCLLKMVGQPGGELVGRALSEFVAAEDQESWKRLIARARTGEAREEMRLHRKGELVPVLLSLKRYPVEQFKGLCLIAVDLSERKQAEEQARAASRYTRSLIEASLDPLVTISKDGKVMDVNAATEEATGKSRQELIGTDFAEYFTDPEEARRGYEKVFETGLVRDYPLAIRHRNGQIMEVLYNASVYRDQKGEVEGVFAAARDITDRNRAEQAARRLAAIVESSDDAIMSKTLDGTILTWNQGAERLYGYTAGEMIGRSVLEIIPEDYHAEFRELLQRIARGERIEHHETIRRCWDGRRVEVSATLSPTKNARGEVTGTSTITRDITASKAAEKALRQASAHNRSLIESSLDPLVTIGPDGKITDVNAGTEGATGRSRQELIGTDFSSYFTDPEQARAGYEQAFREGLVRDYPLELRHRTGTTMPVLYNASVFRDEAGAVIGVFAAARDITERKRAELELRRLNRALRALSRCTEAMARANDEQELLRTVCEVVVQEGGYPLAWVGYAENDTDKSVRPVAIAGLGADYVRNARITWADTERGRGPTGTAIRSGVPCYVPEITLDPRFTPWREAALDHGYASAIAIPLLESGRGFGALNIYAPEPHAFEGEEYALMLELAETLSHGIVALRSQQERDRAATALQELNTTLESRVAQRTAELAASTEEMESFTYSVSHDLRAPLRHIDGFSKVLLEQCSGQLDDLGRHYLERVREGTQRMGQLVDDLLNLSRLGRRELQLRRVALGRMVEEVIEDLQPEAAGRRVEWRVGALPAVACDPGLMRQVLLNLLSNALKFTRGRDPAVIEVGRQGAELFVRDNGVGFDPQYAGKLFGVFQRLHRSEEFAGTGVGLATVRRILRKHGGDVRAEAAPDAGATFYFTVGEAEAAGAAPQMEEPHAA